MLAVARQAGRQEEERNQDNGLGLGLPTSMALYKEAENPAPLNAQSSSRRHLNLSTRVYYSARIASSIFPLFDTQHTYTSSHTIAHPITHTTTLANIHTPAHHATMLMSSLASIQAAGIYTPQTVPIEKTYGLPAEAKQDTAAASGATSSESSPPSDASRSVTRSP